MHFYTPVTETAQPSHALDQLFLLELVRRPGQHVHLHSAMVGTHQPLDDDGVLVALVLHPKRMFRRIHELADSLPSITNTPDQLRVLGWGELLACPIGLEALENLVHFTLVGGHYGVVARFGQILGFPVKRLDERRMVVDYHRLFVREVEGWVAVDNLDAGVPQHLPRSIIFFFAAAPCRVQHDAHSYSPMMRADYRFDQARVGEREHLNAK